MRSFLWLFQFLLTLLGMSDDFWPVVTSVEENSFVRCYKDWEQFSIMSASHAKPCAQRPPHCLITGFGKLSVYHWVVELHIKWLPEHKKSIRNAALQKWHHLPDLPLKATFWCLLATQISWRCITVGETDLILISHSLFFQGRCWFRSRREVCSRRNWRLKCKCFTFIRFLLLEFLLNCSSII